MANDLHVELVSAERVVWSGEANEVLAKTVDGDLGVLRGHTPVLSLLAEGVVEILPDGGGNVVAAVDGGFLSVAKDRVSILSEHVELAGEIDRAQAEAELEAAQAAADTDEDAAKRVKRAEARLRAADKVS
ncbi:MAG: F0F1 ATP synthase subunit epsilon [Nocardioides sp.]|nr:F0F1 ATP synthase subunit epsilon [Nocardioides sp.]